MNERSPSVRQRLKRVSTIPPSTTETLYFSFVCLFVVRQEAPTPTEATRTEQRAGERRRREAGRRAGGRLLAASQPGGEVGLRLTAGAGRTNRQTDEADKPSGGAGFEEHLLPPSRTVRADPH